MAEKALAELAVGDKVATWHGYTHGHYELRQVAKVTPSGQIVLTDGLRFDKSGIQIGGYKHNPITLHIATPEVHADIRRKKNISYLSGISWGKFDDTTLEQVVTVLKEQGHGQSH